MASREESLQSIQPNMRLDKNFFMRIYGYELTWPGFAKIALDKLEAAGCSKAGEYYLKFTSEYESKQEAGIKEAAAQYRAELERKWKHEDKRKGSEEARMQRESQVAKTLERMNDGDLLRLWQQQKQRNQEAF